MRRERAVRYERERVHPSTHPASAGRPVVHHGETSSGLVFTKSSAADSGNTQYNKTVRERNTVYRWADFTEDL